MANSQQKKAFQSYFRNYLFQFLGFEKDIHFKKCGSYEIQTKKEGRLIIWIGANKIQVAKTAKWIYNADEYLINNVMKSQDVKSFKKYISK